MSGDHEKAKGAERRVAPRRVLETRVALKTEKAILFMESTDVSLQGIRLRSEVALEVGTKCRLVPFFDDVARLFEATGTVVRVSSVPESRPGRSTGNGDSTLAELGVRFDPLGSAEEGTLRRLVQDDGVDPTAVPIARVSWN